MSDKEGKTLHQFNIRDTPTLVQFSEMKGNTRSDIGQNTVSKLISIEDLVTNNLNKDSSLSVRQQCVYLHPILSVQSFFA